MRTNTLTALALFTSSLWPAVTAASCVAFDSYWNLYAFGISGADYNLGSQSTWTQGSATKLTTTGRPPFDGANTQCFLSQYTNAIYVIDADQANPSDIHIYDATASSWSTQKINLAGVDPTSLVAILDHDTNVFFALSGNTLYQLDFSAMKAAVSSPLDWQSVGQPPFTTANYKPVMALAQNHIHFLDVPGNAAGDANIFVIHFAFFQPQVQAYPAVSGSSFPAAHGQATPFFLDDAWQEQFAFIPDDGSATYVVNVQTNSTIPLAGPSDKSAGSIYTASTSALVQLTSKGVLSYLPYSQTGDVAANSNAAWSVIDISGLPAAGDFGNGGAVTNSTVTTTGTASAPSGMVTTTATRSGTGSGTGSSAAPSSTSSGSPNGAARILAGGDLGMRALCGLVLMGTGLSFSI